MERQRRMERHAERQRDLGEGQDVDSAVCNEPLRSSLKISASCHGWRGAGHGQEDESGLGRSGGWCSNPGGSRCARQAQAPGRVGHYQVLMNDEMTM